MHLSQAHGWPNRAERSAVCSTKRIVIRWIGAEDPRPHDVFLRAVELTERVLGACDGVAKLRIGRIASAGHTRDEHPVIDRNSSGGVVTIFGRG